LEGEFLNSDNKLRIKRKLQLSTYDNGATFGQSLLDLKMSKSSTRKRVLLAGILIGGKYAFSRWKHFARLVKFNEDSAAVCNCFTVLLIISIINVDTSSHVYPSVSKYFVGWRLDLG
jgi:hypothetical protein